jgi:hypothetical protein
MKETPQPTVPPEALSWCIAKITLSAWTHGGAILTKAHHVAVVTDAFGRLFHKPTCGAQVGHPADACELAPTSWPACRNCSRKLVPEGTIPTVYVEG